LAAQHVQRKKRNREEIVASIIGTAMNGSTKTNIMNKSCLSFSQLNNYLSYTLSAGLIYLDLTGKYFASAKGREYLKRFEELYCSENDILEKRRLLISLLEGGDIQKSC
jgi:predicted transcriptional regulator